jgi:AraC family transcriptional regulator, regulatory protein of adaptative response / methylated-DNA-[protein]-cysteine methyltransferase
MTPGEIKAQGLSTTIRYGYSNTPFGRAIFAETARGLSHLAFVEAGEDAAALAELRAAAPRARFERDDDRARALATHIWSAQERKGAPLKINISGTNFQLKVWQALLRLGAREATSYSEIAKAIGSEGMRAVGSAVGSNPVAYLIPCHHVLRKSGGLGGYRWGEDRKRAMLAWEAMGTPRSTPASTAPAARRLRAS